MSTGTSLIVLVVLLLANAYFVAAEFAMVTARRDQLEPRAAEGSGAARWALKGVENVSSSLAMSQLGITACSLVIGAVGEPALAHLFEGPLHALGLPVELSHVIALVIALLIVTFLHMVVGEMVPKNIAIARPVGSALLLGPLLRVLTLVFRPVIALMNGTANLFVRYVLREEPRDEIAAAFTAEEMARLIDDSGEHGHLDPDEHALLTGAVGFGVRTAADVALASSDLETVPRNATVAQVEERSAATGFSRFPVRDALGDLDGYVHSKDLLSLSADARRGVLPATVIRPFAQVDAEASLLDVVRAMQHQRSHMAVFTDDAGERIIMLEDVLEELVGEIQDATSAGR